MTPGESDRCQFQHRYYPESKLLPIEEAYRQRLEAGDVPAVKHETHRCVLNSVHAGPCVCIQGHHFGPRGEA